MITFAGHVDDVERVYADARLYALMSISEGMPIGMLDAMASGLPIVTPDVGEIGTLVADGRNGLIYPGGDAKALAERLETLTVDVGLAEELGNAARADVMRTHSIDAVAEIYRGILSARTRSRGREPLGPAS
jgi:glycosyltransferase involved in cell wall biosynthesis